MRTLLFQPLVFLFLLSALTSCGSSGTGAGTETSSEPMDMGADAGAKQEGKHTQALLLTQDFDFDPSDKDRVTGAYKQNKKITVPADLATQSRWIMFEGPVLENDKVAYRYYADTRHRFDIYGKIVPDLVMDTVSWKYHDIMDWGADILKVGESLGMGSPAIYHNGKVHAFENHGEKTIEIVENGDDRSMIRTVFKDMKLAGKTFDVVQDWSIETGNYYSEIELYVPDGELPADMYFATGIVSHLPEITNGEANGYVYTMNWGNQSYHEEGLGMAVLARSEYGPEAVEDDLSHLLVFRDAPEKATYRLLAVWERDQSGTKDAAGFKSMVESAAN